ncbi:MAG: zinc ribbon-containing protein [Gammaproteobacteria bacterium]|nr:zinc ribbon-containing protein [Gammaproteobacteria bacterium]
MSEHRGNSPSEGGVGEQFATAYHQLLLKLHNLYRSDSQPDLTLYQQIDSLPEQLSELQELSREEQQRIGDYLKRDLDDAARFLIQGGSELRDWLRFDLALIETTLAEAFVQSVDRTRVELQQFTDTLRQEADSDNPVAVLWHSGEIGGIGTLVCLECGETITFTQPLRIPNCPKCQATEFTRQSFG